MENTGLGDVDLNQLFSETPIDESGITQDDITAEIMGTKPTEQTPEGKPAAEKTETGSASVVIPEELKNIPYVWKELFNDVSSETYKLEIPKEVISRKNEDGTPLTEKREYELLKETLKKHIRPEVDEDPFINRYKIARMSKDFDYNAFMSQEAERIKIFNMPSEEYLFNAYKQQGGKSETKPDGYTDEQIRDHVSKMNPIERDTLVAKLKTNYAQYIQDQDQLKIKEFFGEVKNKFETEELENQKRIQQYITSIQNEKTIRGLSFGDADKKKFLEDIPQLIKRDPNTGLNALETYLQSNKNFEKLLPFIVLDMQGKLDTYMSNRVEDVKKKIEKKLGVDGNGFREGTSGDPGIDWNALYGNDGQ